MANPPAVEALTPDEERELLRVIGTPAAAVPPSRGRDHA
jgi:hypothetical protein